jgi:hypothetical protein
VLLRVIVLLLDLIRVVKTEDVVLAWRKLSKLEREWKARGNAPRIMPKLDGNMNLDLQE